MSCNIDSIADFAFHTGEACFVRAVGVNTSYMKDISALDEAFSGKNSCIRLTSLEKLTDKEQIERFRSVAEGRFATKPELLKVMENYRRSVSSVNPTIENNLKVSLAFWYDKYLKPLDPSNGGRKLVYSGKLSYREYLFCLFAYYCGIDVLILMPEGEPKLSSELLKLSQKCILGECSHFDIPEYRVTVNAAGAQSEVRAVSEVSSDRSVFRIPPRPSAARSIPVQSPAETTNRGALKIPPHPNRKTAKPAEPVRRAAPARAPQRRAASGSLPPAKPYKQKPELSYEQLAALAESVVMIAIVGDDGKIKGSASGIVISSQGYILTNFHVVSEGGPFLVRTENSDEAYPALRVEKYHTNFDLAIIRIDCKLKPLPVYSGSKELVRGQKVVAIGSPMGMFNSVSDGIISGFRKMDETDVIQFTAATSRGSSGGALLNMYGEVIGISSAGIEEAQNINLAVSYKQILPFIKPFLSGF